MKNSARQAEAAKPGGPAAETAARLRLGPATAGDAAAIGALLREADLPDEDFAPHLSHFLVARDAEGQVMGSVGAEVAGDHALLRSLVVAPALRGRGVGGRLVDELERTAGAWGIKQWWLLTTTAAAFFAARGFAVAPRTAAPAVIRQTSQFNGGCCRSAVCMTRARRTEP